MLQQTSATRAVPKPFRGVKWNEIKTNICSTYNLILYRAIFLTVGNRCQGYLGGAGMADHLGSSNQMKVGGRTDIT